MTKNAAMQDIAHEIGMHEKNQDLKLEQLRSNEKTAELYTENELRTGDYIILCFIATQIIVLYAHTVTWLWERWTLSVWQHAHGLLILPVVGYLVWDELRRIRHLPRSASLSGLVVLIPALILHMLDTGIHTQLLSAIAFVLALPGFSLLFLGVQRTKRILFPLIFLAFTLPIPLAFTEHVHLALRQFTVASTAFIVPKFGIPLITEATTLYIPNGSLQVADACSGFSTLYASVTIACLIAYMNPDWHRRILVLLAAAPVAIAANIVRVILLILLVQWKGIGILDTSWHIVSGWLTFVLALPSIFWLGYMPKKK